MLAERHAPLPDAVLVLPDPADVCELAVVADLLDQDEEEPLLQVEALLFVEPVLVAL